MTAPPGRKRLALVRCDRIGDFLLWVSTARHYRAFYHDHHITLIGSQLYADLARALPFWDEYIPIDAHLLSFLGDRSKLQPFDLLVNLQYSRNYGQDLFIKGVPAPERIAINDINGPNISAQDLLRANGFYTKLLALSAQPMHELDRNFEILNQITNLHVPSGLEDLSAFIGPPDATPRKRYAVLYPGASDAAKAYPWKRFVAVVQHLYRRYGLVTLLCGDQHDIAVCKNIHWNAREATVNLCGTGNLLENLRIIGGAELVLSNDSMAGHAAALLNRKSVCLVGGGYNSTDSGIGRFFPYTQNALAGRNEHIALTRPMDCFGCRYRCRYNEFSHGCFPCIEYITTESILESIGACFASDSMPSLRTAGA